MFSRGGIVSACVCLCMCGDRDGNILIVSYDLIISS